MDRTQPVLLLQPNGKIKNIPFEYKRLGTTSLIATLDIHSGTVHRQFESRHRHQEFLSFLMRLEKTDRKKGRQIHIICDNSSAHNNDKVREWIDSQDNVFIHFTTPTHASWLNQTEL
ncbi:transposase [candidate division KSB1 bacterium]|nr:transposase [candidate division KSB1 bacterium]